MDTLLIAVTASSLLMAAAMALVLMKFLRDERRRSDARVVALTEMAQDPRGVLPRVRIEPEPTRRTAATRRVRLQPDETNPAADLRIREERPPADFRLTPEAADHPATDVRRLFDETQRSSPWGGRLAVIAGLVVVIGGGGWLWFGTPSGAGADHPARAATTPAATAGHAPLELLSLRHSQHADRLMITGLVQNPRGSAPLTRVSATAFVFGPDGTFLASSRAPLDFTSLRAGDESPFVVTVPVAGDVARYRVGFRAEDGTVIAHVDKRQAEAGTVAQK